MYLACQIKNVPLKFSHIFEDTPPLVHKIAQKWVLRISRFFCKSSENSKYGEPNVGVLTFLAQKYTFYYLLFSHFSTEFSEVELLGGVARERCCNIESIWNFRCDTGNEIMVKTKHDFWSLLDHDVVMSHQTV